MTNSLRLADVRRKALAGIVVALALIPEAIGFSIIAGVDLSVGLYASVAIAIAIVISLIGGRPAMISTATVAVVVAARDLAQGVLAGVLLSGIVFADKVRRIFAVERSEAGGTVHYAVTGNIFFASIVRFTRAFGSESARAVTMVRVRIGDVVSGGRVRDRAVMIQQKTRRPVQFELMDTTRRKMRAWLERRGGTPNDFVFPSRNDHMAI